MTQELKTIVHCMTFNYEQCPYHIVTFVLSKDLEITTLYQFKQKSTALVIYVKKLT